MTPKKRPKVSEPTQIKSAPPYPRWIIWTLYIGIAAMLVAWGNRIILDDSSPLWEMIVIPVSILFLISTILTGVYGIYRLVRFYPKRILWSLGILVAVGLGWMLLPPIFQGWFSLFEDGDVWGPVARFFSILLICQGILSVFWKPVRRFGWMILWACLLLLDFSVQAVNYFKRDVLHLYYEYEYVGNPKCNGQYYVTDKELCDCLAKELDECWKKTTERCDSYWYDNHCLSLSES